MNSLEEIRLKVRALIGDFLFVKSEYFEYTTSSIFTLCVSNITEISEVLVNGVALGSAEYSYDTTTHKIEILASLTTGDQIEVVYKAYKYTDSELDQYITAGIVYVSVFNPECETDFEIEEGDIYPTPENKDNDLISIVTAVFIKPEYESYKLPTISVTYPKQMAKEERIRRIVKEFYRSLGVNDVIEIKYQ